MKKTIKLLQAYAHQTGKEMQSVFIEMLDFFIGTFSPELLIKHKGDMSAVFVERESGNGILFEALGNWIRTAEESIAKDGISDFFGELYESMFLGKSKASAMGQFFTPIALCQTMANFMPTDDRMVVGEPSCGSGRNVLAHWQKADRSKFIEYLCEDLDPCSVKMCALNMMINEMYGRVICHDSLDHKSFHFGYAINEVRYPLPSPYYSIRAITKEQYFNS